jgi:hypothetical protein
VGGVATIMNPNTSINRKPLFIVGGIIAGLILLFIVIALLMPKKGVLSIEAPTSSPVNVTVTSDDAKFNQTVLLDAAETRDFTVAPGSYQVSSSTASLKSLDIVTVTAEKTTKVSVSFAAASTATKVAAGLDYCPVVVQGKVYDYSCIGDGFIYEQNGMDETKSILFDSQWFGLMYAYKDGFLGFLIGDDRLQYIDLANKQITPLSLPSDLTGGDIMKIATPQDPSKTYFAISYDVENAVYIFKDVTDPDPIKLKLPSGDFLSKEDTMNWPSFTGDTFVLYSGPLHDEDVHEGELQLRAPEPPKGGGKIVEYDLSGKLTKTIGVPDDFRADRVLKLNDNYYVADRIEGVEFFYLEGNKLKNIHTVSEIAASIQIKDRLYMQAENDIYLFQPGDQGSFSIKSTYTPENDQTLNTIYTGPGYLLFTATPPGREVSNVYRLDN